MDLRAVAEELKGFGLTAYEAKCYVALVKLGPADPKAVAREAKIPYPSAYEALRRLSERDWVEMVTKRPASYRARRPEAVGRSVSSRVDEAFGALAKVYKEEAAQDAELVYTLRGRERVAAKVYEMVEGASESIILAAPSMSLEDGRLLEALTAAIERGVTVRAVGDDQASGLLPPGTEIRTGNLVAVDLLVDDKVALISLPDYSACGWIDSPAVASHFKQFLELMWETSAS